MTWSTRDDLPIWNALSAVEIALVLGAGGELPANVEDRRRRIGAERHSGKEAA